MNLVLLDDAVALEAEHCFVFGKQRRFDLRRLHKGFLADIADFALRRRENLVAVNQNQRPGRALREPNYKEN